MFTTAFTPRWVNPGACYERLEFLGDSVLSTTMSAYLYKRYPNEDEGFLSSVRSRIVCGASLSKLSAQHTPFGAFINRLTKNSDMSKALHARIMEDVFEAFWERSSWTSDMTLQRNGSSTSWRRMWISQPSSCPKRVPSPNCADSTSHALDMSLPFASKHHPHPNHQCDV